MPIKLDYQPAGLITAKPIVFEAIKSMTDHYRKSAAPGDTKSAWISREEVNVLLDQNEADGIRIYFGRYPDDIPEVGGRLTVILVATKLAEPHNDPETDARRSRSLLNEKKEANSVSATLYVKVNGDYEGMGADAIPLCPYHCPDEPSGLDN